MNSVLVIRRPSQVLDGTSEVPSKDVKFRARGPTLFARAQAQSEASRPHTGECGRVPPPPRHLMLGQAGGASDARGQPANKRFY